MAEDLIGELARRRARENAAGFAVRGVDGEWVDPFALDGMREMGALLDSLGVLPVLGWRRRLRLRLGYLTAAVCRRRSR